MTITNLLMSLPVKECWKSVSILVFDEDMDKIIVSCFLTHSLSDEHTQTSISV